MMLSEVGPPERDDEAAVGTVGEGNVCGRLPFRCIHAPQFIVVFGRVYSVIRNPIRVVEVGCLPEVVAEQLKNDRSAAA